MKIAVLALGLVVAVSSSSVVAQRRLPSTSGLLQRVSTQTSVTGDKATPGSTIVLRLEVKPNNGIRVFAPGAKDFTPVIVVVGKSKGISSGKPSYDVPAVEKNPGNNKRVPLYTRAFHIDYTAVIDERAKPGTDISVNAILTYQSCDDRIVYPKRTLPLHWTVRVVEP